VRRARNRKEKKKKELAGPEMDEYMHLGMVCACECLDTDVSLCWASNERESRDVGADAR